MAEQFSVECAGRPPRRCERPGAWPHRTRRCDMAQRTCSIDGCDKPLKGYGWCRNHYERQRRHGDPLGGDPTPRPRPVDGLCTIDGCDHPHYARGWCNMHYLRWRHNGDPLLTLPPSGGCPPGHPIHVQRVHRTGPDHPNWAGDDPSYRALHGRVRKERGPASEQVCLHADDTCEGRMNWANISHEYRDVQDFMPLCQSHHIRYDRESGSWGITAARRSS